MEQKRDLAIVLRAVQFEERHRVVTALTETHGKVSALARNSIQSRRFGGGLDLFAAGEWRFVERVGADLFRVEGVDVKRGYEGLRADFLALSLASAFSELMIKIAPEREPCPDLFRLHANALAALEETGKPLSRAHALACLNAYLAKMMQWSGNQPQLGACRGCVKPLSEFPLSMSVNCAVADAGWYCSICRADGVAHIQEGGFRQAALRVSVRALVDFYASLDAPIKQAMTAARASETEHEALFRFIEMLLEYHLPGFERGSIKSLKYLEL